MSLPDHPTATDTMPSPGPRRGRAYIVPRGSNPVPAHGILVGKKRPPSLDGSGRPALLGLLTTVLAILAWMQPASAGQIGFSIQASVETGTTVNLELSLTQTGDEDALDVRPRVSLQGETWTGEKLPRLSPGQTHSWDLQLSENALPPGTYVTVIRVAYTDVNAYPFEVLSTAGFSVGVAALPPIKGSWRLGVVPENSDAELRIRLKAPEGRTGSYDVELFAPNGLRIIKPRHTIDIDASHGGTIETRVANLRLLPRTQIAVAALVTNRDGEWRQTDTVAGTVRIGTPVSLLSTDLLLKLTALAALILIVLESLAVREK